MLFAKVICCFSQCSDMTNKPTNNCPGQIRSNCPGFITGTGACNQDGQTGSLEPKGNGVLFVCVGHFYCICKCMLHHCCSVTVCMGQFVNEWVKVTFLKR